MSFKWFNLYGSQALYRVLGFHSEELHLSSLVKVNMLRIISSSGYVFFFANIGFQ